MHPADISNAAPVAGVNNEGTVRKEAVRDWLRRRRETREALPSIEQIRAELGWTPGSGAGARQEKC
jgi:hypothetical protein